MSSAKIQPTNYGSSKHKLGQLTAQQQLFIAELVASESFSVCDAARKAGYKNPSVSGSKLLGNKVIARAVGKALKERISRTEITADKVLGELAKIAFYDPREMFNEDGSLKNVVDLPDGIAHCLSSVKVRTIPTKEGDPIVNVEVNLCSKLGALELIAKHLGMLDERLKVESDIGPNAKNLISQLTSLLAQPKPSNIIDAEAINKSVGLSNVIDGTGQ